MKSFLKLTVVLALIAAATAYSSGAPDETCSDMLPKHPVDPQKTNIPYVLTPNKQSVRSGDKIQLTLSSPSGKTFKGLFVQGHGNNKIVGTFVVPANDANFKAVNCLQGNSNAATHKNSDDKKSATLTWVAPKNFKGTVQFYATVAENGGVFWVKKPVATVEIK